MAMVHQVMPSTSQPDQHGGTPSSLVKLKTTERVIMVGDNTCCEKIKQAICPCLSTCFCPRRYKLANVEKGYAIGDEKLYVVEQTRCCCPEEWSLKNLQGEKIHTYSRTHCCYLWCSLCCGGPGMDVVPIQNGQRGGKIGAAVRAACQCFSRGYDIRDGNNQKKYFVGNPCFCCEPNKYFTPIWNDDHSEMLRMNVHVTPGLKKCLPCLCCCLKDYKVIDFPSQATVAERSDLVAGAVMSENTIM